MLFLLRYVVSMLAWYKNAKSKQLDPTIRNFDFSSFSKMEVLSKVRILLRAADRNNRNTNDLLQKPVDLR